MGTSAEMPFVQGAQSPKAWYGPKGSTNGWESWNPVEAGNSAQEKDRGVNELCFLEWFALLADQQWTSRENQALAQRLKAAKLKGSTCAEDIDYRAARRLDKAVMRAFAKDSACVRNHENIFVIGQFHHLTSVPVC